VKEKLTFITLGSIALVAVWTVLSLLLGAYIIPPPWTALFETVSLFSLGFTWKHILITLFRVFAGFSLGFVSGMVVGFAAGRSKRVEQFFRPTILLFQGIPPILWAIPLILVFGIGLVSPMIVIALICFPLVAVNISEGIKTVPKELEEMVGVFSPGHVPRIREVVLPHLKPFITSSLKLGVTLGIKASVVAEYFGANNGIGFQIQSAYQSLQIKRLFAWGIILILLIILSSRLLSPRLLVASRKHKVRRAGDISREGREMKDLGKLLASPRNERPLRTRSLSFSYQDGRAVLEKVNLEVRIGEVAVISGESGIGKTTLLKIIASILMPGSGTVETPEKVGFVFQDDRLIPWRSISRNVALPLFCQDYSMKASISIAEDLLKETGLSGKGPKLPEELSGGMRKRAALARCFARLPELILFDEPMTGLHKEARHYLWEKFFSLLKLYPVPVVIVTHFPEELKNFPNCSFYRLEGTPAALYPAGRPRT